jgi:hypothetical protein
MEMSTASRENREETEPPLGKGWIITLRVALLTFAALLIYGAFGDNFPVFWKTGNYEYLYRTIFGVGLAIVVVCAAFWDKIKKRTRTNAPTSWPIPAQSNVTCVANG